MRLTSKKIGLFLGPLFFILILYFFNFQGLTAAAKATLAATAWIAIWWILEVLPLAVTSLLPILLFPLSGALNIADTTESYGHRFIFLFVGGFILALAMQRWKLHKRIALNIISLLGTSITKVVLGFMISTAFLSMWISNTATAVMMLTIGLAVVVQLKDNPATDENENLVFGKVLMLAIAYSSSIGGMASLIGTPPNLILAGVIHDTYQVELSFFRWMLLGLPISIILLITCWWYLTKVAFRLKNQEFPGGKAEIQKQLSEIGKITKEEKYILYVFCGAVILWIGRSFLINPWLPEVDDTLIALLAGIVLFLFPSKNSEDGRLMNWETAVKLPWGVLLLFGAGFAIAEAFSSSHLAQWIAEWLTAETSVPLLVLLLIWVTAVNFLTELTSNMATTAMMLPILIPVAISLDIHPLILMVGVTLAASCAFMLPVATAPNAVVFGSGYLSVRDMARTGLALNFISILLVTVIVYWLMPLLWDLDPFHFPVKWSGNQ